MRDSDSIEVDTERDRQQRGPARTGLLPWTGRERTCKRQEEKEMDAVRGTDKERRNRENTGRQGGRRKT